MAWIALFLAPNSLHGAGRFFLVGRPIFIPLVLVIPFVLGFSLSVAMIPCYKGGVRRNREIPWRIRIEYIGWSLLVAGGTWIITLSAAFAWLRFLIGS